MKASGSFKVKLNPISPCSPGEHQINLGRMSIEKVFEGDLQGISKGEMLSAITPVKGSAGYVAIEQFTGALNDKQGSFVLQHFGVMVQGKNLAERCQHFLSNIFYHTFLFNIKNILQSLTKPQIP